MNPEELNNLLAPTRTTEALGIPAGIVVDLIYRVLFQEGDVSVSRLHEIIRVSNQVLDELLSRMQLDHLVEVAKTGALGRLSYTYRLTEEGTKRARDAMERTQYIGPAPVSIDSYRQAILIQTRTRDRITPSEVKNALRHLILPEDFHRRIGPAVNSGSSLFLYGPPGNGKTTIAQAIAGLLAGTNPIWLPYAITIGGQIIQIYDPLIHIATKDPETALKGVTEPIGKGSRTDRRWELFRRPAVIVGGELKMESLDLRFEPIAKFYEAPLQLKANGGMFLIDDFGRQQIRPQDLLNRWIVPLESGVDFLRLQSGQTLEIPFRQLSIFSTNLEPNDLADEAFLRRIQLKVLVDSPDEKLFYQIFVAVCRSLNMPFDQRSFVFLLQEWYRKAGRTIQSVHARDIVRIVHSLCSYEQLPVQLTPELINEACNNYFVR